MTAETATLEQLLIDLRDEARVLDKHGDTRAAKLIDDLVDRVRTAAEDYLTWLPEEDAVMRSAHNPRWFRARFAEWQSEGHAKKEHGRRYYRQLIVPQRANVSAAREAGREEARRMSA